MRAGDRILIALSAFILVGGLFMSRPAMAATHHHHHHYSRFAKRSHITRRDFVSGSYATAGDWSWGGGISSAAPRAEYHGGYGPRPRAWCGWEMRQLVGSDPGPAYNLARNWAHWGRSGPAGIGAVVVWSHHVGKIVGGSPGHWLIESGNDGHQLRTRERSIGGVIAIRWG